MIFDAPARLGDLAEPLEPSRATCAAPDDILEKTMKIMKNHENLEKSRFSENFEFPKNDSLYPVEQMG